MIGAGTPSNHTCTPSSELDTSTGLVYCNCAPAAGPSADPKIETTSPGATGPALKLAALTTPPGVITGCAFDSRNSAAPYPGSVTGICAAGVSDCSAGHVAGVAEFSV